MGIKSKIGRITIAVLLAIAMLGFSGCASSTTARATTSVSVNSSSYFTVAVLPDTQYYSQKYPDVFTQQTQWIVNNARTQNIVFVSQEGDLVNDYSTENDVEWKNAQKAMGIIRNAGIPYSVVPGNHDVNFAVGDTSYYDKYFPFTDFTKYPWYGSGTYPPKNGAPQPNYPANSNASNYETFSALGQNFVVLNLACTPKVLVNADLYKWTNSVLQYYSNDKAIVVTHGYIDTNGNYTDSSTVSGVEIWQNVVKPNSNVVAVFCGHIHGEYAATVTATHGNTVENLLFDTQEDAHGGDGWLRLYKFYPGQNRVAAVTYSPYLKQYDTSATGTFDFNLNMTNTPAQK